VARDFQKKYLSTYLGMVWAFINPLVYILTIWFVVSIGLRSGEGLGYAFFALAGIGHDTLVFYQGWAEQCCRIAGGLLISDKENVFQGWYYPSDKIIHRAYYPPVYAGGFDNHRGVVRILPYDLLDSNSLLLTVCLGAAYRDGLAHIGAYGICKGYKTNYRGIQHPFLLADTHNMAARGINRTKAVAG